MRRLSTTDMLMKGRGIWKLLATPRCTRLNAGSSLRSIKDSGSIDSPDELFNVNSPEDLLLASGMLDRAASRM